eukprot:1215800-Karenia_brevis.AAC.1
MPGSRSMNLPPQNRDDVKIGSISVIIFTSLSMAHAPPTNKVTKQASNLILCERLVELRKVVQTGMLFHILKMSMR